MLVLLCLEHAGRQLGGQLKGLARVALYQGLAHKLLTMIGMVGQCRVKVRKTPGKKRIHHAVHLFKINRGLVVGIQQGQAHTAKAKFLEHEYQPFIVWFV